MATKKTKSEATATTQPAKAKKKAATPKNAATVEAPAVKKPAAPKAAPSKSKPVLTAEAIALRAYYIAEERYRAKKPGSPNDDWLEAERQLLAEAQAGSKAKKTASK